jgi:hypothetical protein
VLQSFLPTRKAATSAPFSLSLSSIIFGQDHTFPNMPEEDFYFEGDFSFPRTTVKRYPSPYHQITIYVFY